MHNKRGQISEEVFLSIPRFIFLIAILFTVVLLVKIFIITTVDISNVESNIFINRLLYSKNGLSYYEESLKRMYPGVIDLNKFRELANNNPNSLDNIAINYGSNNPMIAARITLTSPLNQNQNSLTVFYNKERFDRWEPRTLSTVKGGAGSVRSFKEQRYVIVKDGEESTSGILEFYVII